MNNYSLVVIDMQPEIFSAAKNEDVLNGCKKAIKKTIKNNNPIIFVEYGGKEWPTTPKLTDITYGYKKTYYAEKWRRDGSENVSSIIYNNKLPHGNILICGVKTIACVLRTTQGLSDRLKDSLLFVLDGAVGGHYDNSWYKLYNNIVNCTIVKI